jgi:hypothetical protein
MTVPGRSSAVPVYGTTRNRRTPIAGIDIPATVLLVRLGVGDGDGEGVVLDGVALGGGGVVGGLGVAEGVPVVGVTSPAVPATSAHPTRPAAITTAPTTHLTLRR